MLRVRIFEIFSALSDHMQILPRVQDLFLMLGQKYGNHLLPICEPLLPILIVKVFLDIVFGV